LTLFFLILAALASERAAADAPSSLSSVIYAVLYQCPNEAPQTFQYSGSRRVPAADEVKLETQWYWGRARTDRGQNCAILSVDGVPFRP
jgi:hypothetical protein